MADQDSKTELLYSLRRLIRGSSALFWGLPLSLVICVQSAVTDWLRPMGIVPPMLATGMLFYGLTQLSYFQKQERIWQSVLERAKLFALINVGLSPFIYWWQKLPQIPFYTQVVGVLGISGLLFLYNLNHVLQRLTAMLPDETLRSETRMFSAMNQHLITSLLIMIALYFVFIQLDTLPQLVIDIVQLMVDARRMLVVVLVLVPLAMTMTLLWKIKELVLASVFTDQR